MVYVIAFLGPESVFSTEATPRILNFNTHIHLPSLNAAGFYNNIKSFLRVDEPVIYSYKK